MRSLSLVMSEYSVSGRGQGHVSNMYIVDLEEFRHSKSTVVCLRLDRVMVECTIMFITHCPTVTLQLRNFITSICSRLVVQVVSALLRGNWQDFNWHDASRGPLAIAELLLYCTDYIIHLYMHFNFICGLSDVIIKIFSQSVRQTDCRRVHRSTALSLAQ